MPKLPDIFDLIAPLLRSGTQDNPWETIGTGHDPVYSPDYELLAQVLSVPVNEGSASQTGRFAKAIDAWVAQELRRAGFGDDEVWPRLDRPRVLPREVGLFIEDLPKSLQPAARRRLEVGTRATSSDARVLGRAYVKQIDVLIAQWARGPELAVSTKSMVSSFRKNLPNRFEEAYGDAKNLRGRYPLASMGFLFLMHSSAMNEPGTFERAIDMLRKLRAEEDVYDATCIVLAEWDNGSNSTDQLPGDESRAVADAEQEPITHGVSILTEEVPADLRADQFLASLINCVLDRTPVEMHVGVRERREHRELPVKEVDTQMQVDEEY